MNKLHFLEKLSLIVNSLVISLVASFIRLIFHRNGSFIQACLVFFGGIIFGTFVGYIIDGIPMLEPYSKILVAASALAGKEIVEFVIKDAPSLIKKMVIRRIGGGDQPDDSSDTK